MRIHVVTIFPEFFRGPFSYGIVRRAQAAGVVDLRIHDLRDWTSDRHRTVDDRPFGGGEGMVMKVGPIDAALADLQARSGGGTFRTVLLSAQGCIFDQDAARRLARADEIALLCGRYEGVDERVAQHLADEEISIGSYVLSGGELAAAVVADCVTRLLPGAVGNEASTRHESFAPTERGGLGILDHPQFTRPANYESPRAPDEPWSVPDVLLSGHHAEVARWRGEAAVRKTKANRPDLMRSRRGTEREGAPGAERKQ